MKEYVISKIKVKGAKDGALRDIHKQMIGRNCSFAFTPEKGYNAWLCFSRDSEDDERPSNVRTSIVYNITEREQDIVLETMNTIYVLTRRCEDAADQTRHI